MSNIIALGIFALAWVVHSWLIEKSRWHKRTFAYFMEQARRDWILNMSRRDLRMIDTSIMTGLQSGTGFFASTSLFAIGASFTLLGSADRFMTLSEELPIFMADSKAWFEFKAIGLMLIYAYAFLKFGWAYRLFNYTSILMGTVPMTTQEVPKEELDASVRKAVEMSIEAAREFNRGQRAFFIAIAYLGWFLGNAFFIGSSLIIFAMMITRQFASPARNVLAREQDRADRDAKAGDSTQDEQTPAI